MDTLAGRSPLSSTFAGEARTGYFDSVIEQFDLRNTSRVQGETYDHWSSVSETNHSIDLASMQQQAARQGSAALKRPVT